MKTYYTYAAKKGAIKSMLPIA